MKVVLPSWVALLSVLALSCSSAPSDRGAAALEASLLAPCCYNGTLVTHESDLARSLRGEIESRVAHGETTDAIRADMVGRYGTRVLAMPSERRFGAFAGISMLIAAGLTVLAVLRVRSWLRTAPTTAAAPATAGSARRRDDYDDRIDAELDSLD